MKQITSIKDLSAHLADEPGSTVMASTSFKIQCDEIIQNSNIDNELKSVLSELCQVQRETFAKYESALQAMLAD